MQYGPGAENAFPGISSAYADGVPILLLPLGNALDRAQTRPLFRAADAFRPVTKHFETIARPDEVGPVMRRAMSALRNGPPGPVMVEMPDDVAGSDVVIPTHRPVVRAGTQAADADVERALATVRDARRPIILAGAGILRAGAGAELLEFAEQLRLPVVTTLGGKSSFPESHPLALGTASLVMADHTLQALQDADAVLALGCSLTRHFLSARLPQDARIVQLTIDPRDLDKTYATDTALVGDARLVLRQLITAAASSGSDGRPAMSEVTGPIASARDAWVGTWRAKSESDEVPITPYRALSEFMAATDPDETIVTHDSGSPRDQILPFYRAGAPGTYMGWGKSHALGSGVGLIMGAKLAAPDKFCVHFMGDAAFGMTGPTSRPRCASASPSRGSSSTTRTWRSRSATSTSPTTSTAPETSAATTPRSRRRSAPRRGAWSASRTSGRPSHSPGRPRRPAARCCSRSSPPRRPRSPTAGPSRRRTALRHYKG